MRHPEALDDRLLDLLDGDLGHLALWEDVLQHLLRELDGHRPPGQRREGDNARERAFELADVRGDAAGDEGEDLRVGDVDRVRLHLLAQDGDARLQVGRLDVGDQPPLEAAAQARLERRDRAGRPVGRDHDLPARLVEAVEGVEELLLDPLLVLEELDVVDQEDVVVAVALLEALDALVAQRVDEVVHERLARDVPRREVAGVLGHVGGDRLEEVGLPQPGAAVDEERVVGLRRRLRDRERGRVREAVRRADDERVEGVLRVEPLERASRASRRSMELVARGDRELPNDDAHRSLAAESVAHDRLEQAAEMALDPVAGEVVRDEEDEDPLVERARAGFGEPGGVGRVVQSVAQAGRNVAPKCVRTQL